MASDDHWAILAQGAVAWNAWRERVPGIRPDLSGADLREFDLQGFDLRNAIFDGADLRSAYLQRARLEGTDLTGTTLEQAELDDADLSGADLRGVDLRAAGLWRANLSRARLESAHLHSATLMRTDLRWAQLQGADLTQADAKFAELSQANLDHATLRGADLARADLSYATLTHADLTGASLLHANVIEADFQHASLNGCRVYGISAWGVKIGGAVQANLVITRPTEPTIAVDNLEVAYFVHLLLNHQKLRDVITSVAERGVLILGRFGDDGLKVLHAVAGALRERRYLPIIFDFNRPEGHDYTETVRTLAGLCRFVVADLSGPSVPHELYSLVPHLKIPYVFIVERPRKPYSMVRDLFAYPWVVKRIFQFGSVQELLTNLPTKVIEPAESRRQQRRRWLGRTFAFDRA